MREGDELPAWAKPRRPEGRPTWVVVLAVAMLMSGGRFLVLGANQFFSLRLESALDEASVEQLPPDRKVFADAMTKAVREHPAAVRANAVTKLVLGALLLFAVAAVFSSDPRARRAAMLAAWVEIAFQLGDGLFLFLISRHDLAAIAPTLLALSQAAGGQAVSAGALQVIAGLVMMGIGLPGIAFAVVLLAYFGGARGRTFFGAGAAADARPL
jgi:hypothetical protein